MTPRRSCSSRFAAWRDGTELGDAREPAPSGADAGGYPMRAMFSAASWIIPSATASPPDMRSSFVWPLCQRK